MNYFARLLRRRPGTIRYSPRRVLLQVEILEDRLAPATIPVTNFTDNATIGSGSLRAAILQPTPRPAPIPSTFPPALTT